MLRSMTGAVALSLLFRLHTMTTEETSLTATLHQRPPLPMSPTQALTTRFDVDAGPGRGGSNRGTSVSLPVGSESRQGFRIGELRLMMRYDDGSELAEMVAVHRLPNA